MLAFIEYIDWCKLNGLKPSNFSSLEQFYKEQGVLC